MYRNEQVIRRHAKDYSVTIDEATTLFDKLVEYLSGCAKHRDEPPGRDIDPMWHTFLLYTKDYRDFCLNSFGKFLDHIPRTINERLEIVRTNVRENSDCDCQNCVSDPIERRPVLEMANLACPH